MDGDTISTGQVKLISEEEEAFVVDVEAARISELVNEALEGREDDDVTEIPLPNVKAAVLKKVIEFCQHYRTEPLAEIEKPLKSASIDEVIQDDWYANFIQVDYVLLYELMLAANFMNIQPLLNLAACAVAIKFKDKTPQKIREAFNLGPDDFTPEEEARVRSENTWL